MHSTSRPFRPLIGVAAPLVAALMLAACGAGGGGGGAGSQVSAQTTPPESGCGSFPAPSPKDPDGVLAALPKIQQDALERYPLVHASAWNDWKPANDPPYSVGIAVAGGVDPLQTTL